MKQFWQERIKNSLYIPHFIVLYVDLSNLVALCTNYPNIHQYLAPAHLSKVTGMVLVEVDAVVVLSTGVSATSRMLPVLACKQSENMSYLMQLLFLHL